MGTLDPRLRHLLGSVAGRPVPSGGAAAAVPALASRVAWRPGKGWGVVDVLIRSADLSWARKLGPTDMVTSDTVNKIGVYTGRVAVDQLETLARHESVDRVEASRPLFPELNVSRDDVRAGALHDNPTPVRGSGVVVAVADSGIDYTHPNFRHDDGSSRILYLWDQGARVWGDAWVPYGIDYTKADLDRALGAADPFAVVPHSDDEVGHGTHVAGIAAGNERSAMGMYSGIAPEADLIVVALEGTPGVTLGTSARLADAVEYAVNQAAPRPVVVNISQGTNGGGHAGETLIEQKLDELASRPGVVIVKSAGNERDWSVHAGGRIGARQSVTLDLLVPRGNRQDEIAEIWFGGDDHITVAVQAPSGLVSRAVAPGQRHTFTTIAGNDVTIDSVPDSAGTGDTSVTLIVTAGMAEEIETGTWQIRLGADQVCDGRYDAWIERAPEDDGGREHSRFADGSCDPSRTITIPGTARRVITVGSHVTRPRILTDASGLGRLSPFSSSGPTRLGARKPDLSAPGEVIVSARCSNSAMPFGPDPRHTALSGTSMAASHVAGAAALVLSVRPDLTGEQVKQLLQVAARRGGAGPDAPDDDWGAGRLDLAAAIAAARAARFPAVRGVYVDGSALVFGTDIPADSSVHCHTVRTRLAVGKTLATLAGGAATTSHRADLTTLGPGDYLCEIVVSGPDGLVTADHNDGRYYAVPVLSGVSERPPPCVPAAVVAHHG
ncbi:S8 family peptidase [Phytohabitans flavus]|uniref:S8 family peptidase n=1 Tax=Phytohabitans flavus TaxID=1076124 RepID=UPI0036361631